MKSTLLFLLAVTALLSCSKPGKTMKEEVANSFYDQAFDFRDSSQADSAYLYFSKAKDYFLEHGDSLGAGKCLLNMAIISTDKGDFFGSQELSLDAMAYFNTTAVNQHVFIQSNLNNLGNVSYQLMDYAKAVNFYQESTKFTRDTIWMLTVQNNIANAYRRSGDYRTATAIYKDILSKRLPETEYARVASNYAYSRWLQNPRVNIESELISALRIRQRINDFSGQVASFLYLIETNEDSKPQEALTYASKMYEAAKEVNNPGDQLAALRKLVKLSQPEDTKRYFQVYQSLNDSVQTVRNAAKNQFALIRYEAEKNKEENLKLQKENAEKALQVAKRDWLILLGILFFISAVVIAVIWYKKRRQVLEAEKEKAVTDNRLKTSKRVHDVVANGLYRVIAEIENTDDLEKEALLDKLEDMYEKSRDISYDSPTKVPKEADFHVYVETLIRSFLSQKTTLELTGNTAEFWQSVDDAVRHELEHVLQELMVNMSKHSQATHVVLRCNTAENKAVIEYVDNGIGITGPLKQNNGLTNTGTRIKNIKGQINFDTTRGKGLRIFISFPTH